MLVIEPVLHSLHESLAEAVEYLPAAHRVHAVAPVLVPVLVTEPALQGPQYTSAGLAWKVPASHSVHEALFEPD